jgi:hypothetical protein
MVGDCDHKVKGHCTEPWGEGSVVQCGITDPAKCDVYECTKKPKKKGGGKDK